MISQEVRESLLEKIAQMSVNVDQQPVGPNPAAKLQEDYALEAAQRKPGAGAGAMGYGALGGLAGAGAGAMQQMMRPAGSMMGRAGRIGGLAGLGMLGGAGLRAARNIGESREIDEARGIMGMQDLAYEQGIRDALIQQMMQAQMYGPELYGPEEMYA